MVPDASRSQAASHFLIPYTHYIKTLLSIPFLSLSFYMFSSYDNHAKAWCAFSPLRYRCWPNIPNSARKQQDIANQVARYAPLYDKPLTEEEIKILTLSLADTAEACSTGRLAPASVLHAHAKRSFAAHAATNCLADVMFDEALPTYVPNRPFSGVPISIKDVVDVEGHDSTMGFSSRANRPALCSAPIIRLLKDAGALVHVKTTVPTGLFSFECNSDLFGVTTNPYNSKFSPGGSTGGGAALLAYGGSKIEIASDIGGSVRFPAAYCGVYGMKSTSGRFPESGIQSSIPGLQTLPAGSPLAKTLDDLEEFWARLISLEPWKYDSSVRSRSLLYTRAV